MLATDRTKWFVSFSLAGAVATGLFSLGGSSRRCGETDAKPFRLGVTFGGNQVDNDGPTYPRSVGAVSESPSWLMEAFNDGSHYRGTSVDGTGDVNGDGYGDVIIGAPGYPDGITDRGVVVVHHGSPAGLSPDPNWFILGDGSYSFFGISVSSAGDVNGDGYGDVIFGAGWGKDFHRVFVVHGSPGGLQDSPAWSVVLGMENDPGPAVSTAGDVNGDGFGDVIVGIRFLDNYRGAAFVYHGSPGGLSPAAAWSAVGSRGGDRFGTSVSTAGDVNGDGYDDVIVGASGFDNEEADEGAAFVFHGSPTGLSPVPNWSAESNQATAFLGKSVSTVGDINGDGYDDVVVGMPNYNNDLLREGGALIFQGSASGLSSSAASILEGNDEFSSFGNSVSGAGDVNADGYDDVVVGARLFEDDSVLERDEGAAFVFLGSASGISSTQAWMAEGEQKSAYFGTSVSTAGDVNGDGGSDVIVGAQGFDDFVTLAGQAFVYHGLVPPCPAGPGSDDDGDGVLCGTDNCWFAANSSQEDVDGDGVGDVCDNCIWAPNPTQGAAVFGQTIRSGNRDSFSWPKRADIRYVRGNLSSLYYYGMGVTQVLQDAQSFTDVSVPPSGDGFYYLVRSDCPIGSWQTTLGAEPRRDTWLP